MSSFSLPSAGGVVSLLNDVRPIKVADKSVIEMRPALLERHSSGSSSAFSTISNNHEGKDSISSTFSSVNGSSTGSLENGKISDIHTLRKRLEGHNVHSGDSLRKREASETQDSSIDDDGVQVKKRKSKEVNGRPTHSRACSSQDKILDQSRLAASPQPLNDSSISSDEKDVPVNMHKATSMSEKELDSSKPTSDATSGESTETTEATETSTPSGVKRRYPCSHPNCDKTFSTSGHAARHNRIHTGSKPYRCTFPGCNASFSRQDNSLQHYRTHVLHPKNRTNGPNAQPERATSIEGGSGHSASSADGHSGLDAETLATVRMGRKALEEGTAIAVVYEVVDGNGRRGEAVQRMVGQPKGNRRASSSTNLSDLKEQDALLHSKAGDDGDDDDDSISVGTSWSYNNHHSRQSQPQHQHPPPTIVHGDYAGYPSHHHSPYPSASSPPNRINGGPYAASPNHRVNGYQQVSPTYFASHDYFQTKYPSGHFDLTRRGSANNLPFMAQSDANRAATAAARRFYSATTSPLVDPPRRTNTVVPIDHRRAHSFGGAQQTRPHLQDETYMREEYVRSASPPIKNSNGSLSLLPNSSSNGAPLPAVNTSSPITQNGMRSRNGVNQMRLPLPLVSTMPYSSDRSTSALPMPTTPLDDLLMHHHGIHSSSDAMGHTSSIHQNDGRTLPPLRGNLRK